MHYLKFLTRGKRKMRDSLFGYMMILTVVILVVIGIGMTVLGTFTKPSDSYADTFELSMELFQKEINSHHEELAMRSVNISKDAGDIIKHYLQVNKISFEDIENSPNHISKLQTKLLGVLSQELLKSESSGAFILLDTTVNTGSDKDGYSKSGIYLQRSSLTITNDTLLLLRGDSQVGKAADIMPHRKWQLEFDSKVFPEYDKIKTIPSDTPIEQAYSFTDITTIPGTSEKVSLLIVPIRSENGETWGICGFEISDKAFKVNHAQPTTLKHLTCIWSPENGMVDTDNIMVCGTDDGYYLPPFENLRIANSKDGLVEFKGENHSYIGNYRIMKAGYSDQGMIAIMIPKDDYDNAVATNTLQIVVFLILISSFAISLCRVLSKRFIAPIVKGLEQIRYYEHFGSSSRFSEIDDLFDFLSDKDKEIEFAYEMLSEEHERATTELMRVQAEIEKLSYSRKNEINPDDYENFVLGIKSLTKQERNIFDMYLAGKTAKEIIEITGIKESTLKFHNSNIYEKLGVSSRKQMLRYAALYSRENGGNV